MPVGSPATLDDSMTTLDILKANFMLRLGLNPTIIQLDNKVFLQCLLGDLRLALARGNLYQAEEMLLAISRMGETLLILTKNKEADHVIIQTIADKAKIFGETLSSLAKTTEQLIKEACQIKEPSHPNYTDGAFITSLKIIIENTPGAHDPKNIRDLNKVTEQQLNTLHSILERIKDVFHRAAAEFNSIQTMYETMREYQKAYDKTLTDRVGRRGDSKSTPTLGS